jgi:hypothetical protein
VRRRHRAAARTAAQQAAQQRRDRVAGGGTAADGAAVQQLAGAAEGGGVDEGWLLAVVQLVLVADLAGVQDVAQQPPQPRPGERLAAAVTALARPPAFIGPAAPLQFAHHRR